MSIAGADCRVLRAKYDSMYIKFYINFNIFTFLHLGTLSSNYNSREVKRFLKEFHEVYLQQAKIINRVRQPSQRILLEIIQIQIK